MVGHSFPFQSVWFGPACSPLHWKISFSLTISFRNCGVKTLPPPLPLNLQCIPLGMEMVWVWSMDIFWSNKIKIKVVSLRPEQGWRTSVRGLASHQCRPGSIPGLVVICGLSLLLVLIHALKGFSPGTRILVI